MIKESFNSGEELAAHHEQVEIDTDIRGKLFNELVDSDIYTANSPIARYIDVRLEVLCGKEIEKPQLFVRKDANSKNAFAMPGVIVVDDGIFELIETQEELDALLAHELTHIRRQHAEKTHEHSRSDLGNLGMIRAAEIEADVLGMRLLDQRGVNPAGMVNLCEKLAKLEAESSFASPTHGKAQDRKINLEQSLWFVDARHLSDRFTPIQVTADEFGDVQQDVLGEASSELSPMMQQRIIFRQAKATEEVKDELLEHQRQLLRDETVPITELDVQARLVLARANPKYGDHPDLKLENLEDINKLQRLLQQPNVDRVTGSAFDVSIAPLLTQYATKIVSAVAQKNSLEETDYNQLLDIADFADEHKMPHVLLQVANEIFKQKELPQRAIEAIGIMIAQSSIPRQKLISGDEVKSYEFLIDMLTFDEKMRLAYLAVSDERLSRAEYETGDIVHSLVYAAKYNTLEERADIAYEDEDDDREFRHEYKAWGTESQELRLSEAQQDAVDNIRREEKLDEIESESWREIYTEEFIKSIEKGTQNDFAQSLHAEIINYPPKDLANLLATALKTDDELAAQEIKDAAALAISIYRDSEFNPANLLELYVLCGQTGAVKNLLDQVALNITQVALNQKVRSGIEESITDLAGFAPNEQSGNELPFSARIQKGHKSLLSKLKAIEQLNKRYRQISPELGVEIDTDILDSCDLVKDLMLIHSLARLSGKHEDATELITLMHTLTPTRFREGGLFTIPEFAEEASNLWYKSVEKILSKPDLLENEESLLALAALGLVSSDLEINLHIPSRAFARIAEIRNFEGALSLISQEYAHLPGSMLRAALDVLVEEKAKTAVDFERINQAANELLQQLLRDKQELVGGASVVDSYVIKAYKTMHEQERHVALKTDKVRGLESTRLMRALLMTGHDDSELKKYIAERWWLGYRTHLNNDLKDKFQIENIAYMRQPGKEARLKWWAEHDNPSPGQYRPLGEALDHLYLSTGTARYVAVRNLLLGEGGVLADELGKASLVAGLMDSWIDIDESSKESKLLEDMLLNLFNENTDDQVYQYISPVLQDMILHTPKNPSSTEEVARMIAQEGLDNMVKRGVLRNPTDRDLEAITQKVITLMRGSKQNGYDNQAVRDRLLGIFDETNEDVEFKHISPTELALLVGKRSGALGTRMLQLAGQYFEIPESERERFAEVYDNMKGQTRLQAFNVLEREARYSPEITELLGDIERFEKRLGGGSLVTVYGVTLKDGHREVLGVRNPNAEYHVRRIADMVQQSLDKTSETHSDQSNLQLAGSLLEDAVEWIRDELNDTTFEDKDSAFRSENDTRSGEASFTRGRSKYEIKVPYTRPTGSLWVRREEYIPGKNLNSLTITDEHATNIESGVINRSDYKDAISLLVRNYMHQLLKGSVAHSDIHPGNFRITPDNKEVVIFDRYNLIPVTDDLRTTLRATFRSLISGNREQALESVLEYSVKNSAVKNISLELQSELAELLESNQDDPTKTIAQMIIALKRGGVRVPIQLSLILRNIFGLANLSSKAGFNNILEAFLHTADAEELAIFQES